MNKSLFVSSCIAVALSLAPVPTHACGSTLFGSGQSSRFQPYRARVPADVLIYASPQLANSSAVAEPGIQDGLKQAGHTVTLVTSVDALAAALHAGHYDVVIASAADAEVVASELDGSARHTDILPLIDRTGGDSELDLSRYAQTLRASAGIGQFLRSINKLMEVQAQ